MVFSYFHKKPETLVHEPKLWRTAHREDDDEIAKTHKWNFKILKSPETMGQFQPINDIAVNFDWVLKWLAWFYGFPLTFVKTETFSWNKIY